MAVSAAEQPSAESLVGHTYLGAHGMYLKTDRHRFFNNDINSTIDHASGLGAEFGYRASELFETRLSYTHFKPVAENNNYDIDSGKSIALDLLYFPFKESFYVVGGADFLDVEKSNLSAALGAGYRHYLSQNMALYFEGKGHYQLDDKFSDYSSKIGFVYFFGTQSKSIKRAEPAKVAEVKAMPAAIPVLVAAAKDSDNDGVIDSQDNCIDTPEADKVDVKGCTIFTDQQESIRLLVNFDSSKSEVKSKYYSEIEKAAEFMKTYPQVSMMIEGHTSARGSAKYNKTLSAKRAQAVVDVLVNKFAIDAARLTAKGFGETQLLDSGNTAEAHNKNRRIEATITATKKVSEKRSR
jgi:OOP family OmpA-OmpF porin